MEKKKKSMKLRTRVIISFFIIILVPIVMCALTFYFFVGYKAKIIGEKYGLANATYRTISNNTLLLNAMTSEEYDEVEDTAKSDTAKLEEMNYLSVLNARLQKKQSFIAVREDGVIIYNGSEELSSEELENELPKYGDPGANSKGGVYFRNEKQWMVKQVDYENSDGKECSAFIVTKTDQIAPQITGMVKELGIVIVLILVFTSLGLSFWIYRGVIGPLEQLKKATQNIKDGNLDFTVEPCGVAEINDLCEDFEEMRIRLKETAEDAAPWISPTLSPSAGPAPSAPSPAWYPSACARSGTAISCYARAGSVHFHPLKNLRPVEMECITLLRMGNTVLTSIPVNGAHAFLYKRTYFLDGYLIIFHRHVIFRILSLFLHHFYEVLYSLRQVIMCNFAKNIVFVFHHL